MLQYPVQRAPAAVDQLAYRDPARGVVGHRLGDQDRPTGLGLDPEDHLAGVLVVEDQLVVAVLGVDGVVDPDGQGHLGVDAAVAENDPVLLGPVHLGFQHPRLEGRRLARVDPTAHGRGPDVVLVLAVLPVQRLGGDHHRRVVVEHGDLEGHDRQVPLGEGDHPGGGHLDPLAARGAPDDVPPQYAVPEVQASLVLVQVGHAEQHGLVIDVQLHGLVVGHVDDGLPGAGEPERLLRMPDRPDLVEAVDEGAVAVGLPALLDVAAQSEVSVADREQAFGHAQVVGCCSRLR